jgi:hypothetical protein
LLPDLERLKTLLPAAGGSGAAGANQPAAAATQGPERLKQAELLVKQRFQKEYEAATTPARKADLAKALLAAKPREQDSPAVLEVVVREALRLALAAGNLELVTQAANRMAEVDSEDPVETKLAALEEFAKTARGMEIRRDIFLAATKLWPAANAADHAAQAVRLARLASDAARKSSNVMFMRQAKALVQQAAALSERK